MSDDRKPYQAPAIVEDPKEKALIHMIDLLEDLDAMAGLRNPRPWELGR